ncbi:MAG: carbohydrate-binding protein [Bacteroidales bacterium]|nr:carbohydrate-binding protein [Bacteroidales bacterium]
MKTFIALSLFVIGGHVAMAQTIYQNNEYKWKGNQFIQGKFKATAKSATDIVSNYVEAEWNSPAPNFMPQIETGINREHWQLKRDISHLPHYSSSLTIDNALYNMSLEESELAIEPDSTYRTGVYWGGVWTRDVSYSILHSLAQLCPEVSMKSLRAKVNSQNRIIQDTGTGGAWPCSTDRTTWVLAAWECYLVTGSQEWLNFIFPVIKNTIEDDRIVAYDPETKLMRGETSWLDWREQEYPTWAEPKDIYSSEAMNTTAVHFRATQILAEICRLQHQPALAAKYDSWANDLKDGMNNRLWNDNMGLYAIYLYGRQNLVQHEQMEILGESFAILWNIASAERQKSISQHMVSEAFGTPDFYPNLKDQYPYHNDAMWPFTQGYWMKAQAKVGNEQGVLHAISSIYRLAALTLTNLENMVIYSGCEKGLPINSPRQLWGVAADASIVPNIYFGISYHLDGIHFAPMVPKALKAVRRLSNFKYRNAVLDMKVSGYGNVIKSFKLDGVEAEPFFSASLNGAHTIEIVLANNQPAPMQMVIQENQYQPLTPRARIEDSQIKWESVDGAVNYVVLKNGKEQTTLPSSALSYQLDADGEYAVIAIGENKWRSYMSEPLSFYSNVNTYEVEKYAKPSATSNQASMITRNENILITIPIDIEADGKYAIDWRYANGNGPVNTENKCATRLLSVDGSAVGVSVFPQRGTNEWNNWGWSNATTISLTKGKHIVTLEFTENVENMNLLINEALIDYMRIVKI